MRLALAALVVGTTACVAVAQSPWRESAALEARRTGVFEHPDLSESSGVAASRRYQGLLWSLNDSGNGTTLFATDTLGRHRGAVQLARAANEDWEAIAAGPCGADACLYIADTGDNRESRPSVRLYRLPEPPVGAAPRGPVALESLDLRYREGPHDVEAMFVDSGGAVHLISKGRRGRIRHWVVDTTAWRAGQAVIAARGTLPIEPDASRGRLVTDAALARDGRRVAVRTYGEVFFFRLTAEGELVMAPGAPACALGPLELQGEGVDWLDQERLVLTSEGILGRSGTVSVVRCPRT